MSSKRVFSPALFDIAQDISFGLPTELLREWGLSDQSTETAHSLLAPTKVIGTTVVSDTAGLTRLTAEKGLVEILSLIDAPKRLVYSYGRAIGGSGVGVWAADNTQMWYPESVSRYEIARMLLGVQESIGKECGVRIGMGAHFGTFYSIGGGLYGAEADAIEEIAENVSEGGEILVTEELLRDLGETHPFSVTAHQHSDAELSIFRLTGGPVFHTAARNGEERYPIPYSNAFHDELLSFEKTTGSAAALDLENRHMREMCVVLVEREREDESSLEKRFLNDFALSLVLATAGRGFLRDVMSEVKVVGHIAIYVFEESKEAVEFAIGLRAQLISEGVQTRIGIAQGGILLFDLARGGRDIAGAPVNIASKMAQDKGRFGSLYMTKEVGEQSSFLGSVPIQFDVSHTKIDAFEVRD